MLLASDITARLGSWVVLHNELVTKKRSDVIEVGAGHLAQD
jgi:hypothetical protein